MNIKIDLKLDKTFIFALVPLVVVFIMLLTNIIVYLNAVELKIPVEFYDPYDVAYGKYLNLTFADNNIVIPELSGLIEDYRTAEGEMEEQFVNTYYELSEVDKEKLNIIFENLASDMENFDNENYITKDKFYSNAFTEMTKINPMLLYHRDYTDSYIQEELMENLADFSVALKNSNMTLKEYMERLNVTYTKSYDEYNDLRKQLENKKVYVYFTVDEKGYAEVEKVTLTKDKTNKKCLVKKFYVHTYDHFFRTFSLGNEVIKYYMDERKVTNAENTMKNAMRNGEVVSAVCKLYNNQIQIKKIMVGDLDLDDYMKLHPLKELVY